MGQVAKLRVAQTSKFGAFLDWGLEKDLFLPFKQQ
jgi:predicted RNA-binding protein (virulence factor B family)